ncbi:MAG TPA: hypothetical protein VGR06_17385 [Actinophytocola sp.]|uniref:hypothetical protein n=1 Tax=Actinophytocola sp. TaxID=1872138 RepID=UPI002DFDAAC9|nr:hypothetical protein [Actinophytocola sp.]
MRGQVVRPPGPDPRSGGTGTPVPMSGDPVHATDLGGHMVATTATAPGGQFELTLPPGTYRITEDICGAAQQVEIRSGTTTSLTLTVANAC